MKKKLGLIFISLSLLLFLPGVFAQDFTHVISNSEKWQDVYSSVLYANLEGVGSDFLVSTRHGPLLLNGIKKSNILRIISSKDNPFVFNYPDTAESLDFAGVDEIKVDDANLELIEELDINNFIIISDSYGYSAVAVAPYAIVSRSWVFLANRVNIAEIDSILSRKNINKIIVYGYVDREIKDTLSKYDPEIINTGDRFKDNIEIVKEYLEIKPTKQVALSNGEFIEKSIMSGFEPVLFTGRDNVPDQIRDYLKTSNIEIGVLVGNDLVGAATNIRRSTGISVMVKFARGARSQNTGIAQIEGLDLFYLPIPSLDLKIHSVKYNKANSQLELTYESNSNVPAYFKGTINLVSDSEEKKIGDYEPVFIAPNDFKTVIYTGVDISGEDLKAEIYTLYGEIPSALDRILEGTFNVSIIDVIDKCEINVDYVKYNKQKKSFLIKVKNIAPVDCWVDIELNDIIINDIKQTIGTDGSERIEAGKTRKIIIEQRMDDRDLEDNNFVELIAYYGEKQDSLVKILKGRFELKVERFTILTYSILLLILLILLLLILIIILKKRQEEFF